MSIVKLTRAAWGLQRYAYPAWARRNMRSKYRPHQGAKESRKVYLGYRTGIEHHTAGRAQWLDKYSSY